MNSLHCDKIVQGPHSKSSFLGQVFKSLLFLRVFVLLISVQGFAQKVHGTDWLKNAQYGVLVHYLHLLQNTKEPWNQGKITSWNSCVNAFDAKKFAADISETGARYVIFTTQQNDQFFSCPNSTFEKISGYKRGVATPHRDLINDIYLALKAKGIALMLYVTGNGPYKDEHALNAMNNRTLATFVNSWSKVLKDISLRYKAKVKGWWVDGAYPFIGYNDSLLAVLRTALKSGNENAIVAFNQAPKDSVSFYTSLDDYTAGEMNHINSFPKARFIRNAQWHAVTFLGKEWGVPGLRFRKDEVVNYVTSCNRKGGVVTLDVCLLRDGSIDAIQKEFLKSIKYLIKAGKKI
jgi:alpha-L-fucosidase